MANPADMIKHSGPIWRRHLIQAFLILAIALGLEPIAVRAASVEKDYKPLFDGQTLKGWTYIGKPGGEYFVSNGVIVCPENSMGNLVTDQEYGDFSLRLEYKFESNGNNGVAIRAPMSTENLTYVGVEIQMLDDTAPKHRNLHPWQYNGSVYGIVAATNGTANIGAWNTEEIECIGRNYRITLNGHEIVHANLNEVTNLETMQEHPGMFRLRGHLGFLGHDSHFEFRNIRIKELDKPEKDNLPPAGFRALFQQDDFLDSTNFKNGELELNGSVMNMRRITNASEFFNNFELLVDAKRETEGGAGIILPGSVANFGNSKSEDNLNTVAESGALFESNEVWTKPLIYAEKPVGDWNRFQFIVLENKVHVFLNGQLVQNDAILANRPPGHIAGYTPVFLDGGMNNSKAWFKNIYIREIK